MDDSQAPALRSPIIGAAARVPPLATALLILAALALLAPGIAELPPVDGEEARTIETTRAMHATRDYLIPRLDGAPSFDRPVGIHWLQAVATAPFGAADAPVWAYRLPSLAGALVAVVATWVAGLVLFGPRAAVLAALLMAAGALAGLLARLALPDAAFVAAIVVAQAVLARSWMEGRTGELGGTGLTAAQATPLPPAPAIAFWLAAGIGILVGGAAIVVILGLTLLGLTAGARSLAPLRRLRPLMGLAIVLAVVGPWSAAAAALTGGELLRHVPGLIAGGPSLAAPFAAPPGTQLAAFVAAAWPMSAFALLAAPLFIHFWRAPAVWFCLMWLVPPWLVAEAVAPMPRQALALYPAVALLAGAALARAVLALGPVWRWVAALVTALVAAAGGVGSLVLLVMAEGRLQPGADIAALAAIVVAALAAGDVWRGRLEAGLLLALLAAAILYAGLYLFALPALAPETLGRVVALALGGPAAGL